jgi:hypothetical protein
MLGGEAAGPGSKAFQWKADTQTEIDRLMADPTVELSRGRDNAEVQQLLTEIRRIDEAIEALTVERQTLVSEVSKKACLELTPHYKKMVRRVLAADRELAEANKTISDMFITLDSREYKTGFLRPMQFLNPGAQTDPNSAISLFAKECEQYGFLDDKEGKLSGFVESEPAPEPPKTKIVRRWSGDDRGWIRTLVRDK